MLISDIKDRFCNFFELTFPEYQNIEITQLKDITSGWENDLLSFDLGYQDQGKQVKKELVARIYPATNSKTKSAKEFSVMKKLYDLNYPVPKMELLENSGEIIGKPFVIMERIDGPTMGEILRKSNEKKQIEMMELFIDLYVQLHKINWREFNLITPPPESQSLNTYIETQIDEYIDSLLQRGMIDFSEVFKWLRNQINGISVSSLSLIHLDYHPDNILMKRDLNPVVIDWGTSSVLDFRFDLAWTVLLTNAHASPTLGQQVFDIYQQKLGRVIEDFEFFYVFAATRRLTDYAISLIQGSELSGMRPETASLLKQYNQVYQFVYGVIRDHLGVKIKLIEDLLSK
ncbi:MAG: phosphotransferase [Candidatus Heimdallarchaeota archaeon]|nr:MAG: phosphotransferase [Candidatus Heimdallarchaeota archaeon]